VSRAALRPQVLGLILLLAVVAVFPYLYTWPFFGGFLIEFRTFQATRFGLWLIILLGLNLLTGYSGQISLGHAALVAVGAYVAAVLMNDGFMGQNVPVAVAVLAAGIFTGILAFLLGAPALRLSGPYLAIATLAMIIALPQILKLESISFAGQDINVNVAGLTGGVQGLLLDNPQPPGSIDNLVTKYQWLYYEVMVPAILMTFMAWNITRSRVGRAFIAIRDTEVGAEHMGVNLSLYKMTAFGLSGLYAGVGGGLFAYTEAFMSPDSFEVIKSITMLVAVVLGGLASIVGTVFGALFMAFQNEIVDAVSGLITRIPTADALKGYIPTTKSDFERLRGAVYSVPLIIFIIFAPGGLAGLVRQVGNSAPTWWQGARLRVTGWASLVGLAAPRRRTGPDSGPTTEAAHDPEEDKRD
jgi:branched-chain amino acid transport system permease protein